MKYKGILDRVVTVTFTWRTAVLVGLLSPATVVLLWILPWDSASAPAWVQAIGSIAAIAAAVMIANHQHVVAERKLKEDAHQRSVGQAVRLCLFVYEIEQILTPVVPDEWQAGVADADEKLADVFERMLSRLNQNFDDDLDLHRGELAYKLRIYLGGLIFTLRSTGKVEQGLRNENIPKYKAGAKTLLAACREHLNSLSAS